MTVEDLIDLLKEYDPNYEVVVFGEYDVYIDVDDEHEEVIIESGD